MCVVRVSSLKDIVPAGIEKIQSENSTSTLRPDRVLDFQSAAVAEIGRSDRPVEFWCWLVDWYYAGEII